MRESSSELRFPQDYIPPRKDDDPLVKLQKTPYYELVMLDIPKGFIVDEDMLGRVLQLKYAYHDITDMEKFPKLSPHHYLEMRKNLTTN